MPEAWNLPRNLISDRMGCDKGHRLRILEDVQESALAKVGVEGNDDRAELDHPEEEGGELRAGGQERDDLVPFAHARAGKAGGQGMRCAG